MLRLDSDTDFMGAFQRAQLGEFADAERIVNASVSSSRARERVWLTVMNALIELSKRRPDDTPESGVPIDWSAIEGLGNSADSDQSIIALRHASHLRALESIARFDRAGLARCVRGLDDISITDEGLVAARAFAAGWLALFSGQLAEASTNAKNALDAAYRAQSPALVVDAQSLSALATEDLSESIELARRASRMSRTEGFLQQEYIANLVLARVRRRSGRQYMAVRILGALDLVLPTVWRRWHRHELMLSGGSIKATTAEPTRAFVDALTNGDQQAAMTYANACRERMGGWHGAAWEQEGFLAGLGITESNDPSFLRWLVGETNDELAGATGAFVGAAKAYVYVRSSVSARRVLAAALPLFGRETFVLEPPRQSDNRSLGLLCALALAGADGLTESEAFARVYGFSFVKERHDPVLRVLLHRARAEASAFASINRVDDRLVLTATQPALIPDPRCVLPVSERVLRELAALNGAATAQSLAARLSISDRTARAALLELQQQGACVLSRQGKLIEYLLEDTTFHQPSIQRLAAAPSNS